jgi:hypothetical protein
MSAIPGLDYSFEPHPSPLAIRNSGARFVVRYISPIPVNDTNGKNLLKAELDALGASSISVVLVFETTASRMLDGEAAGILDATDAKAVVAALGMGETPVYFACDFDATPAQQAPINAYLVGCASVLGLARVGIYGGFYPVSRALTAGVAKWAFQTFAWSGSNWDPRAQIRQGAQFTLDGASCDHDSAEYPNYGQWPAYVPPPVAKPPVIVTQFAVDVPALSQGAKSDWVKTVQALAGPKRGQACVIDGDFGPATLALVKAVQAAARLPQTGVVNEATWKALLA